MKRFSTSADKYSPQLRARFVSLYTFVKHTVHFSTGYKLTRPKPGGLRAFYYQNGFCKHQDINYRTMTRSNTRTGTSTILIVLLIIFTFPIWIGLAGGLFGLVMGLIGAAIGIVAGVFGAVIGGIGGAFGGMFGWHGSLGCNALLAVALVFSIVMLARSTHRKQ